MTKYSTTLTKMSRYCAKNYKSNSQVFTHASNVYLFDNKNTPYFDFLAGYGAINQGHCHPKIVDALVDAARRGKEVTVVIELRARFDEAENIELASRLQESGAVVVYGVVGFKTHTKMILVARRESDGFRHYVHLGTGNYHTNNARLYTDYSFMSSDQALGKDVFKIFQKYCSRNTLSR